ncbi:Tropomyosin-2 [Pseudolycoriella hygida]|uniref:Tropomyosin-2 n=1 Tax=Pseudolycoriella hygida TaxID=35572 RepID=A0A9Q0N817_9DIPT|nr:Tropomyosin-2 [Pseudolycoriella hygida]
MPYTNEYGQLIGDAMPKWRLRPNPKRSITLTGRTCRLEPLDAFVHANDLYMAYSLSADNRDWTYLSSERFTSLEQMQNYIAETMTRTKLPNFAVVNNSSKAVGIIALTKASPSDGIARVGRVIFSPLLQRTVSSTEAQYLLMCYVFDDLGYRRYEWTCNSLNVPSRISAVRLGFTLEGILRKDSILKGHSEDTAFYSIIDDEWPKLKRAFQAWLAPSNFDGQGQQLNKLIKEQQIFVTMEVIKKKMQAMKLEKDNAEEKADTCENQVKDANIRAEKLKEEVKDCERKLVAIDLDFANSKNQLEASEQELEEKEKTLTATEAEVATLSRKVQQIEEDLEKTEERSITAQHKLLEATQKADENNRVLEARLQQDEERIEQLTNQLKESRLLAEDADGKSDEVSRKMAFVEDELEAAEERVKTGYSKVQELDEELQAVCNSLKSLENSEQKANNRVEEFKIEMESLTARLKAAETRAENAEKLVKRLQKEVDRLEDRLFYEKEKYKAICDDMDSTFAELTGY